MWPLLPQHSSLHGTKQRQLHCERPALRPHPVHRRDGLGAQARIVPGVRALQLGQQRLDDLPVRERLGAHEDLHALHCQLNSVRGAITSPGSL